MTTTDQAPGAPGTEPPAPAGSADSSKTGADGRPTTRAGRKAHAAAKKAAKQQAKDSRPKSTSSRPRKAELKTRLAGSRTGLGTTVAAIGAARSPRVQVDGVLIVKSAPDIADALDQLAKDDPRVAAALERMLAVGVWGNLFTAMTPLLVGLAMNHGLIPQAVGAQLGFDQDVLDLIAQTAKPPAPAPAQPAPAGAAFGEAEPGLVGVR